MRTPGRHPSRNRKFRSTYGVSIFFWRDSFTKHATSFAGQAATSPTGSNQRIAQQEAAQRAERAAQVAPIDPVSRSIAEAVPAGGDPGPSNYVDQMEQAVNKYCSSSSASPPNPITCQRRYEEANVCLRRAGNALPAFTLARQYVHSGTPPKDAAWMAAKVTHVPPSLAYAATQMPPSMLALEFANLIMQRCIEDIED